MYTKQQYRKCTAIKSQYFCKQCGKVLFKPGTLNPALGIPNTWLWHMDGARNVVCTYCNNVVAR